MVLPYINMNLPWVYTCSPSWTPLPPPSPYHPSGSSQCTSPKHPVSCIEPGLAISFLDDTIHVSMPFSQIIPPSPTESKRLFYTSVSLFKPAFSFSFLTFIKRLFSASYLSTLRVVSSAYLRSLIFLQAIFLYVCSIILLKYEKGQRKLLTHTSEGGRRVPPSLVLARELYTF